MKNSFITMAAMNKKKTKKSGKKQQNTWIKEKKTYKKHKIDGVLDVKFDRLRCCFCKFNKTFQNSIIICIFHTCFNCLKHKWLMVMAF